MGKGKDGNREVDILFHRTLLDADNFLSEATGGPYSSKRWGYDDNAELTELSLLMHAMISHTCTVTVNLVAVKGLWSQ